jgi:hypothetical protein
MLIKPTFACQGTYYSCNSSNYHYRCKFCECQLSLKNYEEKLFSQYHVQSDENGISRSMSVVEKIMNSVLSFVKSEGNI